MIHNIETAPLPAELDGSFDAAIMESCLHHFIDGISALRHVAKAIKPDGLIVVIEGENRAGPIKDEWLAVMKEFHTLERPYPRHLLEEMFRAAGLPHYEFFGQLNGWFAASDPQSAQMTELLRASTEQIKSFGMRKIARGNDSDHALAC